MAKMFCAVYCLDWPQRTNLPTLKNLKKDEDKAALIIFVRNAVLGKVKTRLAATMGNETALNIYQQLLTHTHSITQNIACQKFIFYADEKNENDLWENDLYKKQVQHGDNLGERMGNAFNHLFCLGYKRICIVGSDCVALTTNLLHTAFEHLQTHDTVIGPSLDGGYYLLGMNQIIQGIFEEKEWSTDSVLTDTMANISNSKKSCAVLPVLSDIDTEEDWKRYNNKTVAERQTTADL